MLQDYWDLRFGKEETHEWLVSYSDVAALVEEAIPDKTSNVLLVGCGNSDLGPSMQVRV